MRPKLLDLFCGAGGAAVGYARAGFEVLGVDIRPMPRYPFEFVQADALEYLEAHGRGFDVIHASPPCQRFSTASFHRPNRGIIKGGRVVGEHPDLLTPTLAALRDLDTSFVVENVPRAPLGPFCITLCGLMFDLKLFRHRRFATNRFLFQPPHRSHRGKRIGVGGFVCLCGDGDSLRKRNGRVPSDHRSKAAWQRASGIDWMTKEEMAQAIPPAYTEYLGRQLLSRQKCVL